jgi:hypothetical protein
LFEELEDPPKGGRDPLQLRQKSDVFKDIAGVRLWDIQRGHAKRRFD